MAVRVLRSRVCDVCGSDVNVTRWRVGRADGRTASPDLCEVCAKPFEEVLELLPRGKRGQVTPPVVLTEAQVRAKKRAYRQKQRQQPPK